MQIEVMRHFFEVDSQVTKTSVYESLLHHNKLRQNKVNKQNAYENSAAILSTTALPTKTFKFGWHTTTIDKIIDADELMVTSLSNCLSARDGKFM